jgi:hypothetical protein
VLNTDLAKQAELYMLLEGTGRVRIGEDVLTLEPLSALMIEPRRTAQSRTIRGSSLTREAKDDRGVRIEPRN